MGAVVKSRLVAVGWVVVRVVLEVVFVVVFEVVLLVKLVVVVVVIVSVDVVSSFSLMKENKTSNQVNYLTV